MFKCEKCGKVTQPGDKINKKVVETREREYTSIIGYDKNDKPIYKTSTGWEIVKEINVCDNCK